MLTRRRATSVVSIVCVLAAVALGTGGAAPAAADETECPNGGGSWTGGGVKCEITEIVKDPGDPSTPSQPPPCDLDSVKPGPYDNNRSPNFCNGQIVCYTKDLLPPWELPDGDKPQKDSTPRGTWCVYPDAELLVRSFWSDDEEPPSLIEQARSAVDNLDFVTPTVGVSPATRTLVNLDTWFWLEGVQPSVSASAFTLTVTAALRSMTVDPGDGSGTFTCTPIATTAAEAQKSCLHQYRRSSSRGSATSDGRPAYAATVRTVYDLTFTNGGTVVTIDGAPGSIDGPAATSAVRVDEAQTVVRPNR